MAKMQKYNIADTKGNYCMTGGATARRVALFLDNMLATHRVPHSDHVILPLTGEVFQGRPQYSVPVNGQVWLDGYNATQAAKHS